MATFDEGEVTDLAEILGTNSDVLGLHLELYAAIITDSDKTAVLSRVTDYQAVEDNDVDIFAKERNFGAQRSSDKKRSLIRARIVSLLHAEDFVSASGSRLVRA